MEKPTDAFMKKCRVCGDRALGFNFNGLSCESCKIFFRRYAWNGLKRFNCLKGSCEIDIVTRKCCMKCRLEKCFKIGMKKELIRSKLIKQQQTLEPENIETVSSESPKSLDSPPELTFDTFHLQAYELDRLQEVQKAMEIFCDERNLEIVGHVSTMAELFNLCGMYIPKVVQFCKSLEGFRSLKQEDQLVMLKSFFQDYCTIRLSFMYSLEQDGFPLESGDCEGKAVFAKMTIFNQWRRKNIEAYFRRFVYAFSVELENDTIIRNLSCAYVLYKPRDNVTCPELLRYHHFMYQHLIKRYLCNKYNNEAKAEHKFKSLSQLFTEMANIAQLGNEIFFDIDQSQMIALLNEIFDPS